MDPLRPVRPGDPIGRAADADTFNLLIDAAQFVRGLRGREVGAGVPPVPEVWPNTTIWVRAHTELPLGAVVRVTGPAAWSPGTDAVTAARQPAVDSGSPLKGEPFVVLQEPAAAEGDVVRAAVSGAALVRLQVDPAQLYDCAEVIEDDTGKLRNVPHGAARVLWIEESDSVERWAVVRLDDGDFQAHVFILSNVPDGDGYIPGVVQRYDVDTKTWQTLFDCKVLDINQ